jgi:Arm DNA-binding domain
MPLTDIAVAEAELKDKPYKITDGKGLYLLVNQVGKYWRLDYYLAGRRNTLALGVYPQVSLSQAREGRDRARALVRQGIDPVAHRREAGPDIGAFSKKPLAELSAGEAVTLSLYIAKEVRAIFEGSSAVARAPAPSEGEK